MSETVICAIKREREACGRIVLSTLKMYKDDEAIKPILTTLIQEIILRTDPCEENLQGWTDMNMDEDVAQDIIL